MFIDLEEYDGAEDIRTDICIVGAGAAGITLALELDGTPHDVCLLESGKFSYDAKTQALAGGAIVGLPYYDLLAARLRFFGGTTNHWAGICRPLDALDFEKRDGIPNSGWPITRQDLDEFYARAHEYCGLGIYDYDPASFANADAPLLPFDGGPFRTSMKLERPLRFGPEYRERLRASRNVRAYLSANVTEIEAAEHAQVITAARAKTLNGRAVRVSANRFVVAAGAIENARLLLCSNSVQPKGLGNDRDLVGRYFMEHPMVPAIEMQLAGDVRDLALYTGQSRDGLRVTGYLTLSPETQRREGMLGACASLNIGGVEERVEKSLEGINAAIKIWKGIKEGRLAPGFGEHVGNLLADMNRVMIYTYERAFQRSFDTASLVLELEQAPDPASRVMLTDETDALGLRRIALDWRLGDLERHTVRRFGELLGLEAGRIGLGRARLVEPQENGWWAGQRGAWHHMGTTRMHADPSQGVVDGNCRVHGIGNLYVAGSSVFTTSGFANPTLTIVALAIRLASHLKRPAP